MNYDIAKVRVLVIKKKKLQNLGVAKHKYSHIWDYV